MCQTLCQVHRIWSRWVHRCSPCKPQNAHKNHRQCYPNILELGCKLMAHRVNSGIFQHKHFFFFKLVGNLKNQDNLHKNLGALEKIQKILATLSSCSARQQSVKTELYLLITFHVHNHPMIVMGFPGGASSKEPACQCNAGDIRVAGLIPGLGRYPGGEHDNPLQYSCLENSHWQRSLVGYSPLGHKESDMTERLSTLLNHKREWNWVICWDIDGPRVCHTEWSKKEKNEYCILMRICGI